MYSSLAPTACFVCHRDTGRRGRWRRQGKRPARLGLDRRGSVRLGSARQGTARLGAARLGSARLVETARQFVARLSPCDSYLEVRGSCSSLCNSSRKPRLVVSTNVLCPAHGTSLQLRFLFHGNRVLERCATLRCTRSRLNLSFIDVHRVYCINLYEHYTGGKQSRSQ